MFTCIFDDNRNYPNNKLLIKESEFYFSGTIYNMNQILTLSEVKNHIIIFNFEKKFPKKERVDFGELVTIRHISGGNRNLYIFIKNIPKENICTIPLKISMEDVDIKLLLEILKSE